MSASPSPPPPSSSSSSSSSSWSSISSTQWVVHKFGGTSVATSECYRNAAHILLTSDNEPDNIRKCAVVSAMGELKMNGALQQFLSSYSASPRTLVSVEKVTSQLIRATELAAVHDAAYLSFVESLKKRHVQVIDELLADLPDDQPHVIAAAAHSRKSLHDGLNADFNDLSHILRACWLSRTWDEKNNWWFGYGELWSARLFASFLNLHQLRLVVSNPLYITQSAVWLDAREVIFLEAKHRQELPDYTLSQQKLADWLQKDVNRNAKIIVCTGYIASHSNGAPTTLGRDGSDYSATIFAALLTSRTATIWTDVDGVYSANPHVVPSAVIVPELSYDEASELAYFGAKVLHPKTMVPVIAHHIPIFIRNTFNPAGAGTRITARHILQQEEADRLATATTTAASSGTPLLSVNQCHSRSFSQHVEPHLRDGVVGFSEIRNLSLVNVCGSHMIDAPGQARRLFDCLTKINVNIILITQGGSEQSISFAVPQPHGQRAREAVTREFRDELETGHVVSVDCTEPVACLAVVGDGMLGQRGVAGRFFSAIADGGVNIVAIAQGSSERNISVIIRQEQVSAALTSVHRAFLSTKPRSLTRDNANTYSPLLKTISEAAVAAVAAVVLPPVVELPSADTTGSVASTLSAVHLMCRRAHTNLGGGNDSFAALLDGLKQLVSHSEQRQRFD